MTLAPCLGGRSGSAPAGVCLRWMVAGGKLSKHAGISCAGAARKAT